MSTIPYDIRKARPDQAQKLSQLAFHSKAHWEYSPEFMAACRSELTYTPTDINHPQCCFYLIESDEACIGFYGLAQISLLEIELIALFISPAYIGQGYGRVLITHAQTQAINRGARTMIIQSDPNAQTFYAAVGAQQIGQRESDSIPGRYLPLFCLDLI